MTGVRVPPSGPGPGQAGARKRTTSTRAVARGLPATDTGTTANRRGAMRGRPAPNDRVTTKRVYDPPGAGDGTRVLIMRYWPRGVRRDRVDVWLRELAPVIPLLRSYLDGEISWAQYTPRYLAGLKRPEAQAALAEVRRLAQQGRVTLLCGCADARQCHRTLLHGHLLDSGGEAIS